MGGFFDTARVEIEFTPGVWTDVSTYVEWDQGVRFNWGRPNPYEQCGVGAFSAVFDNSDGRFTPESALLTTGSVNPYYPNMKENKRIRFRVTHSATTYDLWLGKINSDGIRFLGNDTDRSFVSITASDRFKDFQRRALKSIYEETARAAPADSYFSLSIPNVEVGGLDVPDSIRPTSPGLIVPPAFNTAATQTYDNDAKPAQLPGALAFNGFSTISSGYGAGVVSIPPLVLTGNWTLTVGFWCKTTATVISDLFDSPYATIQMPGAGYWPVLYTGQGGTSLSGSTPINDGKWHFILGVFGLTGGATYTVAGSMDGVSLGSNTGAVGAALPTYPQWILNGGINPPTGGVLAPAKAFYSNNIAYSGLFLADTDLSAFASDLYRAGHDNISGETASARYARILGYCGLTAADWSLATTDAVIGPQDGNQDALSALQAVAQAEYAPCFIRGDGKFVGQARAGRAVLTPTWTIAVADAVEPPDLDLIDEGTATRVTASITGGGSVTVDDGSTSPIEDTLEAPWSDIAQARDAAYRRYAERKKARLRMATVTIDALTSAADIWATAFQFQISDLLRLTGFNAAQAGGSSQRDEFIEGISWEITNLTGKVSLDTTPLDDEAAQVRLDDTDIGRLGHSVGAFQLNAAITNVATTIVIKQVGSDPTFSTTAGDYPTTIKIEAEEIILPNPPGGSGSPQTWTGVTRGANGTTQAAHAINTDVNLWPVPTMAH